MPNEFVVVLYYLMWHCLVILAVLFGLSGLDDLFIDLYFWARYIWRLRKIRHYKPLTYEKLSDCEEQHIAVLIPCWHEANVIGTMLRHNCYSIDYKSYYLFVGVYPNDPATIAEVEGVAGIIPQVQCVIGEKPGPTNKAANLNGIYQHVKQFEETHGISFNIYVFHDSEDVIHPLSFKLYNYLIPRKDMIQIPVFPLEVNYWNFTHWLYADEFSENHTKDIVVRESIKAHVPSAGVGTAFSKQALKILENPETKTPFSTDSLTEDYRTSLALRMHHLKQIFVTQSVTRMKWKKRGFFRKGYVQKIHQEQIATRAMFPLQYTKAVRQKARWIIGIVFQEWDHSLWPTDWKIRYSLAHDRKAFVTHFINGLGYFVFLFWAIYSEWASSKPEYPSLQEQLNLNPWVWWLMVAVSIIMVERLVQRMIATYKIYGFIPALLAVPRAFYGNILNLHAVLRAYHIYFTTPKQKTSTSKQPAWDKTDHDFPGRHVLVAYHRRLGDLLLENRLLTPEQLKKALLEHERTGERLGRVLCQMNFLTETQLNQVLSLQYNLALFPQASLQQAAQTWTAHLSTKANKWLNKEGLNLIAVDESKITLAIVDPTNELLIQRAIRYFAPQKIEFMLIDASNSNLN